MQLIYVASIDQFGVNLSLSNFTRDKVQRIHDDDDEREKKMKPLMHWNIKKCRCLSRDFSVGVNVSITFRIASGIPFNSIYFFPSHRI